MDCNQALYKLMNKKKKEKKGYYRVGLGSEWPLLQVAFTV